MKKVITLGLFSITSLFSQTLFNTHAKVFSYEQNLQRKHIDQMRFDSDYAWRGWGFLNLGVRNNFIGETESAIDALPQIGFDRSYPLSNGELLMGVDLNGGGGRLAGGENVASFAGYGLGGYMLYRTQSECYLSLSFKMAQIFQNIYNQWIYNTMWLFDLGVGKRFNFEWGYFIETNMHFGMGVISDSHLKFMQDGERIKLDSQSNLPFNFLGVFSIGKQIGKHQVKTSISPKLDIYAKGKIFEETARALRIDKPKAHFDLLLSIAYDMKIRDNAHFFTYADFHSLQFEMMMGAGIRVEFGENKYTPLKYPKIKLNKLKKTYLK